MPLTPIPPNPNRWIVVTETKNGYEARIEPVEPGVLAEYAPSAPNAVGRLISANPGSFGITGIKWPTE